MSRALSWISLVFAAAALIVAFTATPGDARGPAAPGAVSTRDVYDLRDRVDALEAALADVESRLDERGAAPTPPPTTAVAAAAVRSGRGDDVRALSAELTALRRDVDRLLTASPVSSSPESREQFKSAVASAQREMMSDRFRQHQERVERERLDELERFVAENGLSSGQADDLRRALEDDFRATRENAEAMRERVSDGPPVPGERRRLMEAQRENLRSALSQILDEEQLKKFEERVAPMGRVVRAPPPPVLVSPPAEP